ncbi:MAG: Gfo/Idh/MocA family oxidoreductase [Planctomycetota bacterium]
MSRTYQAAVVGTGFIGPVHVEALQRAGVQVTGILGSSPARSREAAEQLGLNRAYADLAELLADGSVDVVHITSPNRHHFEQASAALRAGKHVLCEKPLAMTSDESRRLVALAEQSGCFAGVAYNIRFYPLCHESAARVAKGELGSLLHVTGSYVQDWLLKPTDFNWRVSAEDGGALRAVADIGTHWLDLVQFVTGQRITSVCADLQTVHRQRYRPLGGTQTFSGDAEPRATKAVDINTEDAGFLLLRFANGAKGSLHVSQTTAGRKNCLRFEVAGDQQTLAFNSEQPNQLWIGHRDLPGETLVRDPAMMAPAAAGIASYPGGHAEGFPDTFKQLFRTFYASLDQGVLADAMPFPTFADGHREILLCEAILQSHRTQSWVEVAS